MQCRNISISPPLCLSETPSFWPMCSAGYWSPAIARKSQNNKGEERILCLLFFNESEDAEPTLTCPQCNPQQSSQVRYHTQLWTSRQKPLNTKTPSLLIFNLQVHCSITQYGFFPLFASCIFHLLFASHVHKEHTIMYKKGLWLDSTQWKPHWPKTTLWNTLFDSPEKCMKNLFTHCIDIAV